jgi:hypothetical protein
MRTPACVILCSVLLLPYALWGENDCEPRYHWPEYSPFSPGSIAWLAAGWWELPPFCQPYGVAPAGPAPGSAPQVIIVYPAVIAAPVPANQSLATNQPLAAPAANPPNTPLVARSPLYLIALKDGAIHAALSYHVDGGTLRYTAFGGGRKEVSLDQVDRGLSEELNRERHVAFHLP